MGEKCKVFPQAALLDVKPNHFVNGCYRSYYEHPCMFLFKKKFFYFILSDLVMFNPLVLLNWESHLLSSRSKVTKEHQLCDRLFFT